MKPTFQCSSPILFSLHLHQEKGRRQRRLPLTVPYLFVMARARGRLANQRLPVLSSLHREHGSEVRAENYEIILIFAHFWSVFFFFNKQSRPVTRRRHLSGWLSVSLYDIFHVIAACRRLAVHAVSWHHFHQILRYQLRTGTTTCENGFRFFSWYCPGMFAVLLTLNWLT